MKVELVDSSGVVVADRRFLKIFLPVQVLNPLVQIEEWWRRWHYGHSLQKKEDPRRVHRREAAGGLLSTNLPHTPSHVRL